MKIIFLDIDGVLNCRDSKSRCGFYKGIDEDKVKRLRKIVDETDAKIILTSTWKNGWNKDASLNDDMANYLNRKLKRQNLRILDKTKDDGVHRGKGIIDTINSFHNSLENWIVLDDEVFCDYEKLGILSHLVKTNYYTDGLQDHHVNLAINLLNKEN